MTGMQLPMPPSYNLMTGQNRQPVSLAPSSLPTPPGTMNPMTGRPRPQGATYNQYTGKQLPAR
jgi:hypothetical protein